MRVQPRDLRVSRGVQVDMSSGELPESRGIYEQAVWDTINARIPSSRTTDASFVQFIATPAPSVPEVPREERVSGETRVRQQWSRARSGLEANGIST